MSSMSYEIELVKRIEGLKVSKQRVLEFLQQDEGNPLLTPVWATRLAQINEELDRLNKTT